MPQTNTYALRGTITPLSNNGQCRYDNISGTSRNSANKQGAHTKMGKCVPALRSYVTMTSQKWTRPQVDGTQCV